MYVRVAEITSTSDILFKMLMAFIENVMLPRNLAAGQLSGEIFRTSENSCFVVPPFESKDDADKIISLIRSELHEMKGNNRIKLIEGSRVRCLWPRRPDTTLIERRWSPAPT